MTKSLSSASPLDADYLKDNIISARPMGCAGADAFKWDYLEREVLSKLPRPGVPAEVRRDNAFKKLLESEDRCRQINSEGYGFSTPRDFFENVFLEAQRTVAAILGPFTFNVFDHSRFSSGATTSRKRRRGDPYFKFRANKSLEVTPAAYPFAMSIINLTPLWKEEMDEGCGKLKLVPGNRIDTVPKKTEVDRVIAIEPDMNMYLQKSVGNHIRRGLKRWGIDLNDQSRNQRLARLGSLDDSLATIDLSSASDSISYRLVMDLLPFEWFEILDALRCPQGKLGQTKVVWEKFSSMGNGFTFELESLIFYSLARAVVLVSYGHAGFRPNTELSIEALGNLAVYGDDLIISSPLASNLISVLKDVGFDTNLDKTFLAGPFRESCGKHYYHGVDVSPFYIRKPVDSLPRVVWLLNKLRSWSSTSSGVCDPSLWELYTYIRRKYVPSNLLGGNDVTSITSVASPGKPRLKLKFTSSCIATITGRAGVLRALQSAYRGYDSRSVTHVDFDSFVEEVGNDSEVHRFLSEFRLAEFPHRNIESHISMTRSREGRLDVRIKTNELMKASVTRYSFAPNTDWCPSEVPVFPKEVGA